MSEPKSLSPEEMQAIKNGDMPVTISDLFATIEAYRAALTDALEYTQHMPGCSAGVRVSGHYPYGCRCGFEDFLKQAKELLGEEVQHAK